jgi:hypothetical protein
MAPAAGAEPDGQTRQQIAFENVVEHRFGKLFLERIAALDHFGNKLLFQSGHLATKSVQVQLRILKLREELFFLFLDVMPDLFSQYLDLGVEQLVPDFPSFYFGNQLLGCGMFHDGFIDQLGIIDRISRLGVKDLLLDPGMHLQGEADLNGEGFFLLGRGQRLIFVEVGFHLAVILLEHRQSRSIRASLGWVSILPRHRVRPF